MDETEKKFQQLPSTQVTVREKQDHLGVLVSSLIVNVVWNYQSFRLLFVVN